MNLWGNWRGKVIGKKVNIRVGTGGRERKAIEWKEGNKKGGDEWMTSR